MNAPAKRQTYNGWPNRAAWNVALWLGNDYGLYKSSNEVVRPARTLAEAVGALKDFCAEVWPNGKTPDGDRLTDVTRAGWYDIARGIREQS